MNKRLKVWVLKNHHGIVGLYEDKADAESHIPKDAIEAASYFLTARHVLLKK